MVIQDMFRGGGPARPQPTSDLGALSHKPAWYSSPAYNYSSLPPPSTPAPFAVSYLVVGPAVRGRFKPDQAKAQGVTPGPDFARLTRGEAVTLANGKVIQPESCSDPGQPASVRETVSAEIISLFSS